jgi:hypothetical protein
MVKRGKVREVCCPKAIYFGMDPLPKDIASIMIQIALPASGAPMSALEDGVLNKISTELQGKMLAYRVANYSRIRISHLRGINYSQQTREIAMNLAACIVDDAELAKALIPLLQEQDDHIRGQLDRRLDAAILGAVLTCLHERKSDRVQVKELSILANTLLRTQGEIVEYSPEEVGHRLDALSLARTRQSEGMFLLLGRDTSRLAHRLALEYGPSLNVDAVRNCQDCKTLRELVTSTIV